MRIAIIGGGWAGLAAAVQAARDGHQVELFEASRTLGGRARALACHLPDGTVATLDNGQHILIGAYTDTLALMREVGVDPEAALLRMPLSMQFADGSGLACPRWPSPWDALAGILRARGWLWGERLSMLGAALRWQLRNFQCGAATTVADLTQGLSPRVRQELIDPLCVSALNTPSHRASGQVFLRVLKDALFGIQGGSNLLLPKVDLSALFPAAAAAWLERRGVAIHLGSRIEVLQGEALSPDQPAGCWRLSGKVFDAVVLATSAPDAARALANSDWNASKSIASPVADWCSSAQALQFESIATVYAWGSGARLAHPMLALRSSEPVAPAQFVFDRGQLGGPVGLLAFVVSASEGQRDALQMQVLAQARAQLGLDLQPVQTVVEKRATFACTPGLQRPPARILPGLVACGDYVDGPYPATLEGAVRSGLSAARLLSKK